MESPGNWTISNNCTLPSRASTSMTVLGRYILSTGSSSVQIERFDGNSWTTLNNNLTKQRDQTCSVAISDTEMILLGGYNGWRMSLVEKYDVNGNLVETLPKMNKARSSPGCAIFKNELYAVGGWNNGLLSDIEVFNMETKIWRKINNMIEAVSGPGVHVYKYQMIVFGGKAKQVFDGKNWKYADNSIENILEHGVSVPVQCPIFYPV
ncbi:kelch-like protein 20 [Eurytemora carolleeae]|uniref:kelch-like protein 20 n=1 Tax=Eurytemora carolleeae TaxID=1294199 RepID=UPI000C75F458|nr:kelch-like protein 20 [Eurytemora carolleeae]|eukprot:XP_023348350.1 kelch-like protein 20 [Eurytemora affinis]